MRCTVTSRRSVIQDVSGLDSNVQHAICSTLWHAINWIRSILNFFACEQKEYYVAKVAERLENLSLLESILLEDILPSCPSFTPPGVASTGMDSLSLSVVKATSEGKKKAGRPSGKKKNASAEDRKLLIKQSFIALRPEVVRILTSPRLQPIVDGTTVEPTSGRHGNALPMETPLVQFLFSLLEHHVQRCCSEEKKRKSLVGFWTKPSSQSGVSNSEEFLEHQPEKQSVQELLGGFHDSGVLDAAGRFAAHILAATEHGQAQAENEADEAKDGLEPRLLQYKGILTEYLKIVTAAISYDIESGEATPPRITKVQQIQALLLPSGERFEYPAHDPDVLQQVLCNCAFELRISHLTSAFANRS